MKSSYAQLEANLELLGGREALVNPSASGGMDKPLNDELAVQQALRQSGVKAFHAVVKDARSIAWHLSHHANITEKSRF